MDWSSEQFASPSPPSQDVPYSLVAVRQPIRWTWRSGVVVDPWWSVRSLTLDPLDKRIVLSVGTGEIYLDYANKSTTQGRCTHMFLFFPFYMSKIKVSKDGVSLEPPWWSSFHGVYVQRWRFRKYPCHLVQARKSSSKPRLLLWFSSRMDIFCILKTPTRNG